MKDRRPSLLLRLGCGHLLGALILACALLTINGIAVASLYHGWSLRLSEFWRNPRVAQAVLFLGPLFLLVVEWWAIDVIVDYVRPLRRSVQPNETKVGKRRN
jgi:hypothetical protein